MKNFFWGLTGLAWAVIILSILFLALEAIRATKKDDLLVVEDTDYYHCAQVHVPERYGEGCQRTDGVYFERVDLVGKAWVAIKDTP